MFIKWTGQQTRVNSFGSFPSHKPVEVPDYIGKELLQNSRFIQVKVDDAEALTGTAEELQERLRTAKESIDYLTAEIEKRDLQIAEIEQELDQFRAAEAAGPGVDPVDLANELAEAEVGIEVDTEVNEETEIE